MNYLKQIPQSLYKYLLLIISLSLIQYAQATETGPDRCGQTIMISGSTSHFANANNYKVLNATNNDFYKQEIYGADFSANISKLAAGEYTIKVYMAESYHDSKSKRTFDIYVEGEAIVEKLDLFAEVGKDAEYLLSHTINFAPTAEDSELNIRFKKVIDNAKFNTIEVLNGNNELVACGMAHEFIAAIEPIEGNNPFIQHMFTADPSAHVFDDKVYVYPSHDQTNANGFNMRDYHVFSSTDMANWEDHGVALDVDDVAWAKEYMWAPDCAYKNGMYYFYFPARDHEGEFKIGVASSDKAYGPFIPEPEPIKGSFSVDPSVFIDDDGQAYMYFGGAGDGGQTTPWVAKMDDSMKEFAEDPIALKGVDFWFEACWMNRVDDVYYLSYSTGTFHPDYPNSSALAYSTSDSPMGPFTYQGVINGYVSGWTNHHSVLEHQGQSYLFYHNSDLSGGNTAKRSLCVDYIHFADGELSEIIQTKQSVGTYNGNKKIEAENYFINNGTTKSICSEGAYQVNFNANQSISFNQIILKSETVNYLEFRIASTSEGAKLQVSNDKGKVMGELNIENTGGLDQWQTLACPINDITDTTSIVISLTGDESAEVALNWISFQEENTTSIDKQTIENSFNISPNPVTDDKLNIQLNSRANNALISIYNLAGQKIYEQNFSFASDNYQINNVDLPNGVYVIEVDTNKDILSRKFQVQD